MMSDSNLPAGRASTLLVSFHGGKEPGSINNIYSFTGFGTPRSVLEVPQPEQLSELRKFLFDPTGTYLYVANGYKHLSQVLRFERGDGPQETWLLEGVYADQLIDHPFDVIVGPGGSLLVSNQDSNAVTKVNAKEAEEPFASGFKFSEIRGLAYDGKYVYVADAGRNVVIAFDASGNPTGLTFKLHQPVHLLYDPANGWLFIGSEAESAVYVWRPARPSAAPVKLIANTQPPIDRTAGMALQLEPQERATLYVASRLAKQVLGFELTYSASQARWNGKTGVALDELEDNPEFVGIPGGLYG
jgi:DNA-binding beta-propeller fold protein YncE